MGMKILSKLLIFLSIICMSKAGFYDSSSNVVNLTERNFKQLVIDSDDLWLVEFYAPWCGHCKSLKPEYIKAAKALNGIIKVGAVDMTVEKSLANPLNIRGFPFIKFFGLDKKNQKIIINKDQH